MQPSGAWSLTQCFHLAAGFTTSILSLGLREMQVWSWTLEFLNISRYRTGYTTQLNSVDVAWRGESRTINEKTLVPYTLGQERDPFAQQGSLRTQHIGANMPNIRDRKTRATNLGMLPPDHPPGPRARAILATKKTQPGSCMARINRQVGQRKVDQNPSTQRVDIKREQFWTMVGGG
ncbi:hypothetical protein GE09DRAFT_677490 [Coniochaeta sp. 2T2.1]|nr:hypothetical protein GE09DRAFT_677490 [Coniochaeta sp. 2T2.1]